MNTAYGQHFSLAVPNATMGEYFVGSAPGVPLDKVRLTPGTAVPCNGRVTPSGEPGFGLGMTLEQVARGDLKYKADGCQLESDPDYL